MQKSKKSHKKFFIIIVAMVVAFAIGIGAVFAASEFLSDAEKNDNAFANAAKELDKKSGGYDMLEGLSALNNTFLMSESFTFNGKAEYDELTTLRLEFGKDIASTNCYGKTGEYFLAAYDGEAVFGEDGGSGYKGDIKNIFADYDKISEKILSKASEQVGQGSAQTFFEENRTVLGSLKDIVSDNHLNKAVVDSAVSTFCDFMALAFGERFGMDIEANEITYDLLCNIIADIVSRDPDIYKVTSEKNGSAIEYKYSFNLGEFFESVRKYLLSDDAKYKLQDIISEKEGMTLNDYVYNFFSDDEIEAYAEITISGEFTVEDEFLTKLTVFGNNNGKTEKLISVTFSDIDSTKIEQSDYDNVEKKFSKIEKEFENADDVISFLDSL